MEITTADGVVMLCRNVGPYKYYCDLMKGHTGPHRYIYGELRGLCAPWTNKSDVWYWPSLEVQNEKPT